MDTIKKLNIKVLAFSLSLSLLSFTLPAASQNLNSLAYVNLAVNNTFTYNPRTLTWKAIDGDGEVVRTGRGSAGKAYCPDTGRRCHTPTGTFKVTGKRGAECKSSIYPVGKGGSPMPYCMYFSKYYAVHGSYKVPNYNASHGCIRIHPEDARWLYHNFMHVGSKVVVKPY